MVLLGLKPNHDGSTFFIVLTIISLYEVPKYLLFIVAEKVTAGFIISELPIR